MARDDRGALRLDAESVTLTVKERPLLSATTVSLEPGELVAIIGESGAGKTTLLKSLAGVTTPTSGSITINGEPISTRLTDIGYVPQDEIVHTRLTVREALTYAARLRLPEDASDAEIDAAVRRVVGELALEERADQRIGSLSGGQRKRTGVATELLGQPGLLFLDEPTTGMDPGLESRMMALFRELADASRAVALVTHATKNLALCDRVIVMGRGGHLTFDGAPSAALAFFGVDDYDGIYTAMEETPASEWRDRHAAAGGAAGSPVVAPAEIADQPRVRRAPGLLTQTRVLTSRYLTLLLRDRQNLALLVGQAPILGLAGVGLFKAGLFSRPGGSPGDGIQLFFLAVLVATWLGAVDAAREIIKERSVVEREAAIGMRLSAYLVSKVLVLFALVTVQLLLYAGVLFAFRPLHAPAGAWVEVFGLLILTGFVAVAMGLLISAAVSSEDQAMTFLPLAIIPQLLFAGTIVPVARMAEPAHSLSYAIFGQWALAGAGTAVDMNARMAENQEFARVNRFGTEFFDVSLGLGCAVLGGFLAVFLIGTAILLRRTTRT